jgi:hypothetical protein
MNLIKYDKWDVNNDSCMSLIYFIITFLLVKWGQQGGGWCESVESCVSRRDTFRGSSSKMEKTMGFSGILGSKQAANPGS